MMNYKYKITHREDKLTKTKNFKNKSSMLKYLDSNKYKLNELYLVYVYFNTIKLPLKQTAWNV